MDELEPVENEYDKDSVGTTRRVFYASWSRRVAGAFVDALLTAVAALPGYVLVLLGDTTTTTTTDPDHYDQFRINGDGSWTPIPMEVTHTEWDTMTTVGVVLIYAITFAFIGWNACYRQGRTGYSYGKQAVGIRLVGAHTGAPIGAWSSFWRQVADILNALPCYLGYFWPLWDSKNQTFADKVCDTVVLIPVRPPRRWGLIGK